MAFVGGLVTEKEHAKIVAAGYEERTGHEVRQLLDALELVCAPGDVPIIVWVHCDVTDLLCLVEEN